jgi:hypothetical protein
MTLFNLPHSPKKWAFLYPHVPGQYHFVDDRKQGWDLNPETS